MAISAQVIKMTLLLNMILFHVCVSFIRRKPSLGQSSEKSSCMKNKKL